MFRLCVVVAALLWPLAPAFADIPRPLDERATARLIADEVARQNPAARVERSDTRWWITLYLPGDRKRRVEVDGIHKALRAEDGGAARQSILERFVARLLEQARQDGASPAEPEAGVDPLQAMPVLRQVDLPPQPESLVDHMSLMLDPVVRPFDGRVFQCWAVEELPTGDDCLNPILMNGVTEEELARAALANAERRLDEAVTMKSGPFYKVSLGRKFASSLLFLDDHWNRLAGGKQLVAAVPTAGTLLWITDPSGGEIAELRQRAGVAYAAGNVVRVTASQAREVQGISPDLYLWTGTGWKILPP